jgi:hypothetical protein
MRRYTIYIDENLPPQLANGLNILQQPQNKKDELEIEVLSIRDKFGQGETDEHWIPEVGKKNGIVITQDYHIQKQRHQKELYKEHGIGIFFINPPSISGIQYWEMVKQLIHRWEEIKKIIKREKTPFAYRCTVRSKFEKM